MSIDERAQWLYLSLNQRRRPEDVADIILELLKNDLGKAEKSCLQQAAKGSLRQSVFSYTSMLQDFALPVGLQRQVSKAVELFTTAYPLDTQACDCPDAVEQFIRHISHEIHKSFGSNDFKTNRLNRQARSERGMEISKRRYNKLFRHLTRMEAKLNKLISELKKLMFTKVGKSGLAHLLSQEDFLKDRNSTCFIAYYVARSNLRSEFTIYGQQRPYDEIADMLFNRCRNNVKTNWWAIAHVYPTQEVLFQLSDSQKGELLGQWYGILEEIAQLLKVVWERSNINRSTMVVRRGNDSSTWNNTASAWNTARSNWISLLYAMGSEEILQSICFGKVLRLMAADVVAWHYSAGGQLDSDTAVWNELPLPWEVLSGQQSCNLSMIESICWKHHVDPIKKGWTVPRTSGKPVAFTPTPELVHGVSISNPALAKVLRSSGFFSGKTIKHDVPMGSEIHKSTLQEHHKRLQDQNSEVE
ncbi:hypothetical protein H0901_06735 [Microcystis aeruginosa BLCCF158]|uniref:Uncharacterized protein n=1 Tax=Microcystis aeruginosa BLCC-F158 TaxID=2755316 RepID=A0A841V441_MICAE|nr:hypothetical protein [Microcystis aeruginosa]MBC1194986.1 hypothetical protein [Microcystis aeruginosa BLCC-F158]